MNIRLNVKKETFRGYLFKLGYSYQIKQYDDFIKTLGRLITNDIKSSMEDNTLISKICQIFKDKTDILVLQDYSKIENVKEEYLVSLIESGLLDLYLEDKSIKINEQIQESVYIKKRIDSLNLDRTNSKHVFYNW